MLARFRFLACAALLAIPAVSINAVQAPPAQQGMVFPDDPAVINVTRPPYSAKGDGVADDTAAIQKALDDSCGIGSKQTKVLYLPNSTYRVTSTLVVKSALERGSEDVGPAGVRGGRPSERLVPDLCQLFVTGRSFHVPSCPSLSRKPTPQSEEATHSQIERGQEVMP